MKKRIYMKKGFTLVELIVVIAIIGVLAAILVPTMTNYVVRAEVTSANTTAASVKSEIDYFLTAADTAGYGMRKAQTNIDLLTITVNGGVWTVTSSGSGSYANQSVFTWNTGQGSPDSTKVGVTDACGLLAINLASKMPTVDTASGVASLKGGKCVAVAFSEDTGSALTAGVHYPALVNGEFPATFAWNSTASGVSGDGAIIGTAPEVLLG